jgi:hypothetical protein
VSIQAVYKNSISASQMTESACIMILFMEIITVYCETQMNHMIRQCGESAEFLKVAANVTYRYH